MLSYTLHCVYTQTLIIVHSCIVYGYMRRYEEKFVFYGMFMHSRCNDTQFGYIDILPLLYHDTLYDTCTVKSGFYKWTELFLKL